MPPDAHPFRLIAAAMACMVLFPMLIIGTIGVIADDGPMRPVWGIAALGAIAGIGGALRTLWQAVRHLRGRPAAAPLPPPSDGAVVARWSIDGGEGRAEAHRRWSERRREVVTTAAFVFVIATGLLWLSEDGPAWAPFAAGGFLAMLYIVIGLGKYALDHQSALASDIRDVIVFQEAVVVCGTRYAFVGDRGVLGVRLADGVLEFTLSPRDGPADDTAADTLRLPVSSDQRPQAEAVVRLFAARG